jgi:succinate-semialdehyde dehydrogenase/glutarate-semialdehyde dehydrogenase
MFQSINPMTGDVIAKYPEMTSEAVQNTLEETHRAQQEWRNVSFPERTGLMHRVSELLLANKQLYARTMTSEMGKISSQGTKLPTNCSPSLPTIRRGSPEWSVTSP